MYLNRDLRQALTYEMMLIFFTAKTDRSLRHETLSFIIRRVLYICIGKSADGHEESWYNRLPPRLLRNEGCGKFYSNYVNLSAKTLDYAVIYGASTFAKAMAMEKEKLKNLIDRLKDLESPEAIMHTCENELDMIDLEIACDATYVISLYFLLN